MAVLIFANGELIEKDWLYAHIEKAKLIIAANGGSTHLWRLRVAPDVVIGDLDSLSQPVWDWLQSTQAEIIEYPPQKDETDLELALLYALRQSQQTIRIVAAAGGRLDQTIANIQLLAHPDLAGRRIELVTAFERAWLVTGETEIKGRLGDTVSLIPMAGDVSVHQTSGLQWPLTNEILKFGPARGISNKMTANSATVTISTGMLLCIHTFSTKKS